MDLVSCFVQVSPGDTGWDVFSLDYHVEGPIATVNKLFWRKLKMNFIRVLSFSSDIVHDVFILTSRPMKSTHTVCMQHDFSAHLKLIFSFSP